MSPELLDVLTPASAGADLLQRGIQLNFAGAASIKVPDITVSTAGFVAESAPIPVQQSVTSGGPTLSPHKLAVITVLTGEMMRNENAETLVRQALVESVGPALDAALFSNAAGDATRPPGLLNGITALTPAGVAEKAQALVDDLQTLGAAVAPVAGNSPIVLIASPDAAVALVMRLPQAVEWPVLTSTSLAPRTVIAVAANAVVSAVEGAPQIDASRVASVHYNTVPADIVTAGGVAAAPVGSLFQTDNVGLRLRWPISWALRKPAGLAWLTGANW
jgi:Phage capsid family